MKIEIIPLDSKKTISQLGLQPRGRVQKVWTSLVSRRIKKYLPYRNYGSVVKALDLGTKLGLETGLIKISLPFAKYLYFGKVMAGKPKKPTPKDLVYTKSPNAKAGPFWDKRLIEAEMDEMEKEIQAEIKKGGKQ